MRASSRARWLAASLILSAATACSDDGPAGPGGDPTTAEATDLARIVVQLAVHQGFLAIGGAAAPSAAPVSFQHQLEFMSDCPYGGTVAVAAQVDGTTDAVTGALDATLHLAQTHAGCSAGGQRASDIYTLDGAPGLTVTMSVETQPQTGDFNASATFGGAVRWAVDGRSGTCTMDLDIAVTGNSLGATQAGTFQGTVCGIQIEGTEGGGFRHL